MQPASIVRLWWTAGTTGRFPRARVHRGSARPRPHRYTEIQDVSRLPKAPASHLEILVSSRRLIVVFGLCIFAPPIAAQTAPSAPVVKQMEHISVWHGEKVNDPYHWLRDKSNPEVIKYLEAENAYTEAMTADLRPFVDALYREMLGHVKQTDLSVPVRRGGYYYYRRTQEGKQYSIHCRKRAGADGSFAASAAEEILLDSNELAGGSKFFELDAFEVSDAADLLAYSTDDTGFRQHRLYVKDLATGRILPDRAERVTSVEWRRGWPDALLHHRGSDHETLEYAVAPHAGRRDRAHFSGERPAVLARALRSKDKKLMFLHCRSTDTWETRFLERSEPNGEFKVVLPREKGHKYSIDHRDGLFYIRTNRGAKNFRLVTAPLRARRHHPGKTCCRTATTCCCKTWRCSRITWLRPRKRRRPSCSGCSTSARSRGTR